MKLFERRNDRKSRNDSRKLRLERLEHRELLSADGLGAIPAVADADPEAFVVDAVVDDPDDGLTSLREAIAQVGSAGAVITFDQSVAGQTYTLTDNIAFEYAVKIDASSIDGFTIDGDGKYGFRTTGAASRTYEYVDVTFSNCLQAIQLKNGTLNVTDCAFVDCVTGTTSNDVTYNGAAIGLGHSNSSNRASVNATITNSSFDNCVSSKSNGGAIYYNASNSSSTTPETAKRLVISGSTFNDCTSSSSGGAIYVQSYQYKYVGPVVTISDGSSFTNCGSTCAKYGGAVYVVDGTLNISDATFDGNGNVRLEGGAVCVSSTLNSNGGRGSYSCSISGNTTFKDNVANIGGAVFSYGKDGTITIDGGENSTILFQGNSCQMRGGAISVYEPSYSNTLQANVVNVTVDVDGVKFIGNNAGQYGGAIYFQNGDISNCEFTENTSGYSGGAVVAMGLLPKNAPEGTPSNVTITDCSFDGNVADHTGGALLVGYAHDEMVYNTTVTLKGTVSFTDNEATGSRGGAICVRGGTLVTDEAAAVTIEGNTAKNGGAIAAYSHRTNGETAGAIDFTLGTVAITDNVATQDGGAIAIDDIATITLGENVTVKDNTAAGNGGAARINAGGELVLTGNDLTGNVATVNGGAIYCAGKVSGEGSFTNNTAENGGGVYFAEGGEFAAVASFADNAATANGGGAYVPEGVTVELSELTLSGNTATNGGAFYNLGTLSLTDMTIGGEGESGNSATKYGGAIYNQGSVTISGGLGVCNQAGLGGFYYGAGSVEVDGTTFSGNAATANNSGKYGSGGAFYVTTKASAGLTGSAMIANATFEDNFATKYGGAIANYGEISVSGSTFTGNQGGNGGAIQTAGTATIIDSEFEENSAIRAEVAISGDDYGGNGGAIFASNNGSSGAASTLTLDGDNEFNDNAAENAGGAIDLLSGTLVFGDAETIFRRNHADAVGGALVIGGDVDFGSDNPGFMFRANTSDLYAATVAANCAPNDVKAIEYKQNFSLSDSYDEFDSFIRTGSVAGGSLSCDYLRQVANVDSASTVSYKIWGTEGDYTTIDSTGSIALDGDGTYTIVFYVDDRTDVELKLTVTVGTDGTVLARKIDMSDREPLGQVGFAFVSYGKPVSKWVVTWGDDGSSQEYSGLGYSRNAYKICEVPGSYKVSLSVTYADGSTCDFGEVGNYTVEAVESGDDGESGDSGALLDAAFADDELLIDLDF